MLFTRLRLFSSCLQSPSSPRIRKKLSAPPSFLPLAAARFWTPSARRDNSGRLSFLPFVDNPPTRPRHHRTCGRPPVFFRIRGHLRFRTVAHQQRLIHDSDRLQTPFTASAPLGEPTALRIGPSDGRIAGIERLSSSLCSARASPVRARPMSFRRHPVPNSGGRSF